MSRKTRSNSFPVHRNENPPATPQSTFQLSLPKALKVSSGDCPSLTAVEVSPHRCTAIFFSSESASEDGSEHSA